MMIMYPYIFYIASNAPVSRSAGYRLKQLGIQIAPTPDQSVTHLLLPIPSFDDAGNIRGNGPISSLLDKLSTNITVIGGNLTHPSLEGLSCIDLLKDPKYLAENASITAHCALRLAMMELPCILKDCSALVTGWGRIAQCLAQLLRSVGAKVTVAARKEENLAIAHALGFSIASIKDLQPANYRIIFNTVPAMVIPAQEYSQDSLKIDLASSKGIDGKHVIWARGLPGKDAPESTGNLIAERLLQILISEEGNP